MIGLLVAACSSPAPEREAAGQATSSSVPAPPSWPLEDQPAEGRPGAGDPDSYTEPPLPDRETAAHLGELGGQLAIGLGPTLAVARPDGGALRAVGLESEAASQPTWSGDGMALAWGSVSRSRRSVLVRRFDDEGRLDGDPEVSETQGSAVFYLQWDSAGERLAYLSDTPGPGPGLIELGFVEPGHPVRPVDRGAPMFVDWAPSGPRLLAHVDEGSLRHYTAGGSDDGVDRPESMTTTILARGGGYSAPVWIDDERAVVVDEGALAIVTVPEVADGDPAAGLGVPAVTVEPIEDVGGPIAFVVSPDGRRVAYRLLPQAVDGGVIDAAGEVSTVDEAALLVVLDLESGERQVVSEDGPVAWEWSPDGSRLAWLTVDIERAVLGRWHFAAMDGPEPGTVRTPRFALTRSYLRTYLPFFSQYAGSMTGWAPDSSAFAFAGMIDRDRGVWIQLVDRAAPAHLVADGDIVTWGPAPTPDATATPLPILARLVRT